MSKREDVVCKIKQFTADELIEYNEFQKKNYNWDFSSERDLMERSFHSRYNFFLVVYAFVIAAASTSRGDILLCVGILSFGFLIISIMFVSVWRCFIKMDICDSIMYCLPKHPTHVVSIETKSKGIVALFRVNKWMVISTYIIFTISIIWGIVYELK